jgi:hypothetical protein
MGKTQPKASELIGTTLLLLAILWGVVTVLGRS